MASLRVQYCSFSAFCIESFVWKKKTSLRATLFIRRIRLTFSPPTCTKPAHVWEICLETASPWIWYVGIGMDSGWFRQERCAGTPMFEKGCRIRKCLVLLWSLPVDYIDFFFSQNILKPTWLRLPLVRPRSLHGRHQYECLRHTVLPLGFATPVVIPWGDKVCQVKSSPSFSHVRELRSCLCMTRIAAGRIKKHSG